MRAIYRRHYRMGWQFLGLKLRRRFPGLNRKAKRVYSKREWFWLQRNTGEFTKP